METSTELDRERINFLVTLLMGAVKGNYLRGPISEARIFEALNALAATTAIIIQSAGDGPGGIAHQFFSQALSNQMQSQ